MAEPASVFSLTIWFAERIIRSGLPAIPQPTSYENLEQKKNMNFTSRPSIGISNTFEFRHSVSVNHLHERDNTLEMRDAGMRECRMWERRISPFGPRPKARSWTETSPTHFVGPTVSVRSGRPTFGRSLAFPNRRSKNIYNSKLRMI